MSRCWVVPAGLLLGVAIGLLLTPAKLDMTERLFNPPRNKPRRWFDEDPPATGSTGGTHHECVPAGCSPAIATFLHGTPVCEDGFTALPLQYYSDDRGGWHAANSGDDCAELAEPPDVLTVLTWNVLRSHHVRRRARALMAELQAANAHLVGLQEVNPYVHGMLRNQSWVRSRYLMAEYAGQVVVLVARELHGTHVCQAAQPQLARGMLFALVDTVFQCQPVRLGITHVHWSADPRVNRRQRAENVRAAFTFLAARLRGSSGPEHRLFIGDFNIDDVSPDNSVLEEPGYRDAWLVAHGTDRSALVPTCRFPAACVWWGWREKERSWACKSWERCDWAGENATGRLDRVLFRSPSLAVKRVERIGTSPIAEPGPELFVSDHFGITVTLA